ncbi:MAG TPA: Uma2 family endonuclease, partial [Armatimonadota bacterium]|nr:Uma2 family endonuclease [Armatimonadota bacterium]
PRDVRRPDVSFIARGRLPGEQLPKGHATVAPDLAVEVISPNDLFYEVEAKIGEYLEAGVRVVWIVNPQERSLHVYQGDGSTARLQETDTVSGEDVLPGFTCEVGSLFPPRASS